MGLFSKKTWLPRIVPHPGRVRLLKVDNDLYDMVRADGTPTQAGDAFSDTNMNGFESRVENGFKEVESLFNTKIDKSNIAHNLATTNPDMVLGADMGKQLNDSLTTLSTKLMQIYNYTSTTDSNSLLYTTLSRNNVIVVSASAINIIVIPVLNGDNLWSYKCYDIVTGNPVGNGVAITIDVVYYNA